MCTARLARLARPTAGRHPTGPHHAARSRNAGDRAWPQSATASAHITPPLTKCRRSGLAAVGDPTHPHHAARSRNAGDRGWPRSAISSETGHQPMSGRISCISSTGAGCARWLGLGAIAAALTGRGAHPFRRMQDQRMGGAGQTGRSAFARHRESSNSCISSGRSRAGQARPGRRGRAAEAGKAGQGRQRAAAQGEAGQGRQRAAAQCNATQRRKPQAPGRRQGTSTTRPGAVRGTARRITPDGHRVAVLPGSRLVRGVVAVR